MNTSGEDAQDRMMAFTDDEGFDDVILFAPVSGFDQTVARNFALRWLCQLLLRSN